MDDSYAGKSAFGRDKAIGIPIRHYLLFLAVAAAIPLMTLAFILSDRFAATQDDATRAILFSNARALAEAVDQEVEKHIALTVPLSRSRAILNEEWPVFWEQARRSLNSYPDTWVSVVGQNGQVLLNSTIDLGTALPRRPLWPAEQEALRTSRPQLSNLITGVVARRTGAFIAVPFTSRQGHPLLLDITLNPASFVDILQKQQFPQEWLVGIIDGDEHFVARIPSTPETAIGEPASEGWRNAMRRVPEGVVEHLSKEGIPIVDAYAKTRHGWTVGVAIGVAALQAPLRRTQEWLIAASVGCLALGLFFAWLIAKKLNGSARLLQQAAHDIGAGMHVSAEQTGVREYDAALAGLSGASERLRLNAQALLESENQLQTIINATPFMLTRCSRDLRYQFVSRSYAEMLGRRPEDLAGKSILEVMGQEGFDKILPHITKVLQGERVEYESAVHFQGVGERVLHVVYTPERNDRGEVESWVASINDVSQRKRAESQRDVLLAEVNHRVKNTLANVMAIARQSFKQGDIPATAIRAFDSRIKSLARTHTRLADANWSGVSLRSVVDDEIAPYLGDGNVHIEGPDVQLNHKRAVSLGMAFHELATNAAKYGALSVKGGSIQVSWSSVPSENRIVLEWIESGGPEASQPQRGGFGRLLLEKVLPADLNGTIDLDFREAGLRCVISFPVEARTSASREQTIKEFNGSSQESSKAGKISPGGDDSARLSGKRVLIVEDEALLALQTTELLSSAGASVIGPFGGLAEASTAARREAIDIAVLDMNLSGQMVFPLAEELLQRRTPILFLTGYDVPDVPERLRAVPHMSKPFDPADLLRCVEEIALAHQ